MKQILNAMLDGHKKPHCPYCNAGYEEEDIDLTTFFKSGFSKPRIRKR